MGKKIFDKVFFVLSAFIFIIVAIRAIVVPFAHDEVATFFYYIQTGDFLPYIAHPDANNHIFNSFLSWICFRLFGDSPFVLRLPNLAGLVILGFAMYRLTRRLEKTSSKIILTVGLLVSFNWLGFFSVCRGYGLSMALITLAISYIPDYIDNKKLTDILKTYVLLNLALCANLTLIIAILIATVLICIFQLYHKRFFQIGNIFILCIHSAILLFWVKYSFFLQKNNLLYAGQGSSYWKTTFVSLIYTIVGKQNFLINTGILFTYSVLMLIYIYVFIKNIRKSPSTSALYTFFLVVLCNGLIVGFYLLKKVFGTNFPEDRAGLFFYLFFILSAVFIVDNLNTRFSNIIAAVATILFTLHFTENINFCKHTLDMYATIPERFYDRLLDEQKQSPEKITIGGNRFRELFYAFMNYRHNGALNLMDIPEDPKDMFMNDDYYIAYKVNREKYMPYYREIDTDNIYGFTLLKRKKILDRKPVFTIPKQDVEVDKKREFFNLFEIKDTAFNNRQPLLVEYNFKMESGDMPALSWLVITLDSAEGKTAYYKRIPLNWVKYNWLDNQENIDLTLETGPLPAKIHRFVCYLWNFKGQRLKVAMNSIKAFQLEGDSSNIYARVNATF